MSSLAAPQPPQDRLLRQERAPRPRCEHRTCGKIGHTTDNCWMAHPELRPERNRNSRKPARQARNNKPAQQPVSTPFKFFELPPEIRNKIYKLAYTQAYSITVESSTESEWRMAKTHPSCKLHMTCKQSFEESEFFRNGSNTFDGHLRSKFSPNEAFKSDAASAELRSQVTKITLFGFSSNNMYARTFHGSEWHGFDAAFPNVKEVHVEWSTERPMYARGGQEYHLKYVEIRRRLTYHESFMHYLNMKHPASRLMLWLLLECLPPNCKLFTTTTLQWLGYRRKPYLLQIEKDRVLRGPDLQEVRRWTEKAHKGSV